MNWVKETNRQAIDIQVFRASIDYEDIRPKNRTNNADSFSNGG